jgi:K+-sensing histidine kinase KdpD
VAIAELGLTEMPRRSLSRLERRIAVVIVLQLALTAAFDGFALARGTRIGSAGAILALLGAFVATGALDMSLELRRHRFTFTLADAVLVVGFFVVGPLGLAVAFACAEAINMAAQRHGPLKTLFNVANRLAATTIAAVAFSAVGRTSVHDVRAWVAALAGAVCFSMLDVMSTAVVVSMAEGVRVRDVLVRSISAGVLATLAAAPLGLLALDLYTHNPAAVLLLLPLSIAVVCNSRYAVAQRDEHLRFERLYASSARTAGLVAFEDALQALAAEACSLATGTAAICCAMSVDAVWIGAWADDGGMRTAAPDTIERALAFADQHADCEVTAEDVPEIEQLIAGAGSALAVSSVHDKAGRVVLIVFRDGDSTAGATSRLETLTVFANHAALIVANTRLHEERAIALARQLDLNRQKDDFIAAVSHELRTPLAVMLGSVHTLNRLDGRMSEEQRTQLFGMTVDQGARLQRLIDELLLVAAVEHADAKLETEPVEIAEVFASIELDTAAITSGRLVTDTGNVGAVGTDRSQLARVLLNLVENAAKYAATGAIELRASRTAREVCVSVVDHGPGIPEEDRERVFERFVQLDQSSTRRQGGTGLGLHLCKQLTELLDGRLMLTETPGGGCTFSLTFPQRGTAGVGASPDATAASSPPDVMRGSVRVRPIDLGAPISEPAR